MKRPSKGVAVLATAFVLAALVSAALYGVVRPRPFGQNTVPARFDQGPRKPQAVRDRRPHNLEYVTVRSLFAGTAAIWFAYNALTFIPQGAQVYLNDGQVGGIDGDTGAVAVTWAARTLFVGLVLVSLALVEWGRLAGLFQRHAGGGDGETPGVSDRQR